MAQETANITLSLTDELSDKLKQITDEFETLRRKINETSDSGNKGFRTQREEIDRAGQSLAGVNAGLQSMGTSIRAGLADATRELGKIGIAAGGVGNLFGTIATAGSRLVPVLGGIAGGGAAIVAGSAALTGAAYAIARSMSAAHTAAENLRIALGEINDQNIARVQRLGQMMGQTPEQMDAMMRRVTAGVHDMTRGVNSAFYEAIARHGAWGRSVANTMYEMQRGGRSAIETFEFLVKQVDDYEKRFGPEAGARMRRQLAQQLGVPVEVLTQWSQMAERMLPVVTRTREQTEAMEQLRRVTDEVTQAGENWLNKFWYKLEDAAVPTLTAIMQGIKNISDALERGEWWRFNPFDPRNLTPQQQQERERGTRPLDPRPRRQRDPNARDVPFGGQWDPNTPQRFTGGGFTPDLAWAGQLHGGESANIEDRRDEVQATKDSTGLLREIRDILQECCAPAGGWQGQAQMFTGGGGGAGGGGGWGARGGVLGGGGAGAGGGMGGLLSLGGGRGGDGQYDPGGTSNATQTPTTQSGGGAPGTPSAAPAIPAVPPMGTAGVQGLPGGPSGPSVRGPGPGAGFGGGAGGGAAGGVLGLPGGPSGAAVRPSVAGFGGGAGGGAAAGVQGLPGGPSGPAAVRAPAEVAGGAFAGSAAGVQGLAGGPSGPAAARPQVAAPAAGGGAAAFLTAHRAGIMQELQDPAKREAFMGLVQAETGGQGAQSWKAFAETTIDRWAARGQNVSQGIASSYYGSNPRFRSPSAALREAFPGMMEDVRKGSAMFPGATGNASDEPGNPVLSRHRQRGELAGMAGGEGYIYESDRRDRAFRQRLAQAQAQDTQVRVAGPPMGAGAPQDGRTASAQANVAPGSSQPGAGTPGVDQGLGPTQALAFARQHLGEDEIRDQAKLQSWFTAQGVKVNPRTTAWCAGFVNASLNQAGIKGTGSLAAASFYKYGTHVDPKNVQPGDIAVYPHHVGFVEATRDGQYEMLGGNQPGTVSGRGGVSERWRSFRGAEFRRAPAPPVSPSQIADRAAQDKPISKPIAAGGKLGTADVNVNINGAPNGTRSKAKGNGIFENVRLKQTPQMGHAGVYGGGESNQYAEE